MAITAATVTGDFSGFLPAPIAEAYFESARQASVVQQLVRRVPLGINGAGVPVVTSKPTAGWVGEGEEKPKTKGALTLKSITPKKLAAIAVVSAEVVRANPGNYIEILRADIAEAFAKAFDAAALHGTSSPFGVGNYIGATTKSVLLGTATQQTGGVYQDIVSGLDKLVQDGKKLTGFAFDSLAEPTFLGATDNTGRPLFIDTPLDNTTSVVTPGRLIGRRAFLGDGVEDGAGVIGFGGDWSQAVWGAVGGISYDVSTEATVTINNELVSLFEHNLVAIRAEAEYGWLVNDAEAFVAYEVAGSGSGS